MAVSLAEIEVLLAGTQCRQCGYPGCREYAEAIVKNGEKANRCRPGGARVQRLLQQALQQPQDENLFQPPLASQVAEVEEKNCIGCTLCLQACPTGAIVGSNKFIHSVVSDLCTGCGLCLPPCPVACIHLKKPPSGHKLTQQQEDGSLCAEASQATWGLVHAHQTRKNTLQTRGKKATSEAPAVQLGAISGDMAAKVAAAREKTRRKYEAKGPLKEPKHLKVNDENNV